MFPAFDYLLGTQIACLVICIVVLSFFIFQKKLDIKNERYFLRTVIFTMVTALFDIVSIIFNTNNPDGLLTIIIAKMYLITILATLISVVLYIAGDTVYKKSYNIILIVFVFLGLGVASAVALTDLKVIDVYTEGVSTIVSYVAAALIISFILIFSFKNRKKMTGDKFKVIYIWMLSWVAMALIQFFFPKILLVTFGLSVGCIVSYIKIEALDNLIDRDTGLFNWNTYLKYINDVKLNNIKCSIIYLRPNSSFYNMDEKITRQVMDRFNETLRRRKDIVAFSYKNEYLIVLKKNNLNNIREFLSERRNKDIMIGRSFCAYYIPDVSKIKSQDDLESIINLSSLKRKDSDEVLVIVNDDILKEYYNIEETKKIVSTAMENDKVLVYFQPIYSIEKKKFLSAEALVRININEKIIPPNTFLSVAESNGMINKLDIIVFEKVCEFISENDMEKLGLNYIEINLSGEQLTNQKLAETYIQIMEKYNINPKYINLEITESKNVEFRSIVENNIKQLVAYGVKFSLDDYGTGYSNLNYVLELPLVIVKFDKQLKDAYFDTIKAEFIMKYSISMFKNLNYKIVIEGVETKEELDEFLKLNVDYIQGYYFSKPIDKDEFVDFLNQKNI